MANEKASGPFDSARTRGGLALLALVCAIFVLDAFLPNWNVDSIQLGLLLGSALALLGVDAGIRLLK